MNKIARLEELRKDLDSKVETFITNSEELKQFIEFYRRNFKIYSPRNLMLVYAHNRFARFIAGFKKWKELGYTVKKGEKARNILAPVKDNKGEIERYIFVPVFDDSQVVAKENAIALPTVDTDFQKGKSNYNMNKLYSATKKVIEKELGKIICYYDEDSLEYGKTDGKKIYIKKRHKLGMLGTLVHEYTHYKRHFPVKENYNNLELEAEMSSIIFGSIFNFEVENKFHYLHGYKKEKIKLSEVFEKILPFSSELADKVMEEIENGK